MTDSITANLAMDAVTSSATKLKEEFSQSTTLSEHFYNIMAVTSIGTAVAAFMIEGGLVVSMVAGMCAFLGPAAALQQQRLTDLQNMKELHQSLRDQVNRFQCDNNRLTQENQALAQSAKRLKEVEQDLQQVAQLGGGNVQTLLEQVEEYRKIQTEIKSSLEAKIIQNLIEVVIRSDNDQDFIIDKNEVDGLFTRLKSIDGVDFSEENFKRAITKGGFDVDVVLGEQGGFDLKAVLNVVQNLLDDNEEEKVFVVRSQDLLPQDLRIKMERNALVGSY